MTIGTPDLGQQGGVPQIAGQQQELLIDLALRDPELALDKFLERRAAARNISPSNHATQPNPSPQARKEAVQSIYLRAQRLAEINRSRPADAVRRER